MGMDSLKHGILLVFSAIVAPAWAAPKTDRVELVNGDLITCEIKGLEHNRLRVSTDHMGTVYIEWDKVAHLRSSQQLLLERTDGSRYYGQVAPTDSAGTLLVERARASGSSALAWAPSCASRRSRVVSSSTGSTAT